MNTRLSDSSEDISPSIKDVINLSEVIHSPVRLAIMMSLLLKVTATFPELKKSLNLTSGNLSSHITKLESEGFIFVEKKFVNAKPTTIVSLSLNGTKAINEYASILQKALNELDQ